VDKIKEVLIGIKFKVWSHDQLIKHGWTLKTPVPGHSDGYENIFFPGAQLTREMIDTCKGQILTVKEDAFAPIYAAARWYSVEENSWVWPVDTFLETKIIDFTHTCEEGMTTILGWFICKTCGTNLRQIK